MKPSAFYADYQSTTVGITGLTFTEKWTQPALNIYNAQTPNNFSTEAYYLGWISYDNLPIIMGHHSVTVDAENDSLVFVDDTIKDNYPCGYLQQNNQYNAQIFVQDGVVIPGIGNYTPSMYNDLHPEYSALNAAALQFRYYEKINGEIVPRSSIVSDMPGGVIRFGYNQPNTLQELFDFLEGTSTITYTLGNYTYDFDASQLEEGYGEFVSNEDETHSIIIFLSPITPYAPRFSRGTGSGDLPSAFFATVKYEDSSEEEHFYDVVLANDNIPSWGLGGFYWNDYSFSVHNNIKYSGKVSGEFKISDLLSMSATTGYAISGNIFAFCLYGSGGANPRTFFSILSNPADMLRTLSLYYRVDFSGTNPPTATYVDGVTYATNVTADDEFLAELKTGNISDDTFRNGLRYWQYSSIANNDFDEDDVPEYEPPGPDPGGDEDEGSIPLNIPGTLGATNAFTTRYVLNTTQIRTIGQELWSTIGDGNELTWQNFFLTLSGSDKIDYSLTLSEIISYFVSLKYFPFNLNSISSTTGENGIRVGTGASLINAGSTTKTLNDSIVQLDGGTCTIPGKWNNYLDLEPYTTASLYVPYCGTMELPMSVIAGQTIGITYLVDMTTGAMTAAIMKYSGSAVYFPIAIMNGSCGFDILMTGTNGNSQMTNAITNLASKSTQWVGQTLQSGLTGLMGGISGRDPSGFGALSGMANTVMGIGQDMIQQNIQMPKLYATAPMTSGSSSSLSSLILPQKAYIQIRRHNPYRLGTNYQDELGLIGCRSAYQGLISSANGMGFVKCQNPNLANVADAGATEAEINMIKSLLSDGIFT